VPGDRFNEYVLGRSVKADVAAQKMDAPSPAAPPSEGSDPEAARQREDARRRRNDYVHAMVSNRHCRVYCLLTGGSVRGGAMGPNGGCGNNGGNGVVPPEMEVFVEDTSGNGTLVNGTTLLRRNERRRLHTGDVVCLLNPKLLAKKLRSVAERKAYVSQYSYVFVNLYEQEARHGWGVMSDGGRANRGGGGDSASPTSSSKKRGVVDARATKCHSTRDQNANSKRSLFSNAASGGEGSRSARQHPQQRHTTTRNNNNNDPDGIGSFPNDDRHSSNDDSGETRQHRRIEEEYDIRDLLGTGTCGEVRRAIHRRTGEERAVKIISIGGRGGAGPMSAERLAAIRAEAEILRSLDHPYVVELHDMFVSPGRAIYLVMELVRGGDLFDRIVERGRYDEVGARRLLRRILAAVHYLHEDRGIVHRDLKPENILVVGRRSDFEVKLTDFGLAKNMTAEGLKTFCGTPQYFAPEVLRRRHTVRGDGRYGKEIDCWSIGVILFILLSGSPPFDVSAGFDAVANAEVVFDEDRWRSVSREARDLVGRLLQRDPRRRMSVKEACGHKWVLREDGDTHRHPLHDPAVVTREKEGVDEARDCPGGDKNEIDKASRVSSSKPICAVKSTQNNKTSRVSGAPPKPHSFLNAMRSAKNDKASLIPDPPSKPPPSPHSPSGRPAKPPSSNWRKICAPVDANTLSPISTHNKKNDGSNFQSKSAPQPSKDGRRPSIWPANGNDKTVTKAIQQGCHAARPSPNSSPIKKKQLFDKRTRPPPTNDTEDESSVRKRKMTKRGIESVRAAGNTLPAPVIDKESHLIKKAAVVARRKKVQSTLFSADSFKKEDGNTSKPAMKETGNGVKRKSSSTVTPPGMEQNNGATFRLNKKHNACGGKKHISPETGGDVTTAAAAAPAPVEKKSELSEDELRSDFSDDDDDDSNEDTLAAVLAASSVSSPQASKRRPLEKYLRKRKAESIESCVSDLGGHAGGARHRRDQLDGSTRENEEPRPASKSSADKNAESESPPSPMAEEDGRAPGAASLSAAGDQKKMVQTFIFGMPPPAPSNDDADSSPPGNHSGGSAVNEEDPSSPCTSGVIESEGGAVSLKRLSSRESSGGGGVGDGDDKINTTLASAKGQQRSIKSWFLPKK